jgi:predicted DNA-binding protein (UPF0251 family)
MLDMCVRYIARRHHMLTDEHVEILNEVWDLYEPSEYPVLPPSPPVERQHVHFEQQEDEQERLDKEERPKRPQRPQEWPCDRCFEEDVWECGQCVYREMSEEQLEALKEQRAREKEQEQEALRMWIQQEQEKRERAWARQQEADALWSQIPQEEPVSASIFQDRAEAEEGCDGIEPCDGCSNTVKQPRCDPDGCTYECGTACGSAEPPERVIDLTCEREDCASGCECNYTKPQSISDMLPPIESCFYGCSFNCGASPGEPCIAQYDEEGDQLPALIRIVETSPAAQPQPEPQPQPKTPKEQPLFPYNHRYWPSPRARVMVRSMLGKRAREVLGVKNLTHDACMRWLANKYGLTHEQLLATSIYELHNRERMAWKPDDPKPYWALPPFCRCCYCKKNGRWYSS